MPPRCRRDAAEMPPRYCAQHRTAPQVLYIPQYWWHHIENVDLSVSLNFWRDNNNSSSNNSSSSNNAVVVVVVLNFWRGNNNDGDTSSTATIHNLLHGFRTPTVSPPHPLHRFRDTRSCMAAGTKRPARLSPTQHVAMRRNVERIAAEKVKEDPTAAHFHRVLRGLLDEQRAEGVNNNSRSRARHVAAKTTTATPRRGANRG